MGGDIVVIAEKDGAGRFERAIADAGIFEGGASIAAGGEVHIRVGIWVGAAVVEYTI